MIRFHTESLAKYHDRSRFSCGIPALDTYFQSQASQDMRRRVIRCFVAVETTSDQIAGFFTLSALSIRLDDLQRFPATG